MVDQAIEKIAMVTSRMQKVTHPGWRHGRADLGDLARLFAVRLDALRAAGDDQPAVIEVTDSDGASNVLLDLIGDTPEEEIIRQDRHQEPIDMRDYKVGVTLADTLIASTGSVVIALDHAEAAYASLLVERHIVLAFRDQLTADIGDFYSRISDRASRGESLPNYVCITGCSRTADIEKMLVVPAHGPRQVRVILQAT